LQRIHPIPSPWLACKWMSSSGSSMATFWFNFFACNFYLVYFCVCEHVDVRVPHHHCPFNLLDTHLNPLF
jgi:hypothetical protein